MTNADTLTAARAQNAGELAPGAQLHRYRIHRVLGRGGFAISYLATDTRLCRQVALKQCTPAAHVSGAEDAVARCVAEARTLARFSHRGIVRVFDVFSIDDIGYIALEYHPGRHLSELLRRSGCPREWPLRRLLRALHEGIEHVHAHGFIHRDIKPANIYVRADDSPMLLDFGSAGPVSPRACEDTTALVSPGYASLEQYEGTAQGPWTDVYGLGASLYLAVTRRPPVDARRRAAAIRSGCADPLRPATELAAGEFSPRLLRAVDAALALHAHERPSDVAEWRALLRPGAAPRTRRRAGPLAPARALVRTARAATSWRDWHAGAARTVSGAARALRAALVGSVAALPRPHAALIAAVSVLLLVLAAHTARERPFDGADHVARSGFIRRQPVPTTATLPPAVPDRPAVKTPAR